MIRVTKCLFVMAILAGLAGCDDRSPGSHTEATAAPSVQRAPRTLETTIDTPQQPDPSQSNADVEVISNADRAVDWRPEGSLESPQQEPDQSSTPVEIADEPDGTLDWAPTVFIEPQQPARRQSTAYVQIVSEANGRVFSYNRVEAEGEGYSISVVSPSSISIQVVGVSQTRVRNLSVASSTLPHRSRRSSVFRVASPQIRPPQEEVAAPPTQSAEHNQQDNPETVEKFDQLQARIDATRAKLLKAKLTVPTTLPTNVAD